MLIWMLGNMWILDFWVFDILLKCGCLLIWMWDILLIELSSICLFSWIERERLWPFVSFWDKKGRDIVVIILVIGYMWISMCQFIQILWKCLGICTGANNVFLEIFFAGIVVPRLWFWVSEWPCMRVGWGLLVLIRVVKGFVPELPKGKIVSV